MISKPSDEAMACHIPSTCGVSPSQVPGRIHLWVAYGRNRVASVELGYASAKALSDCLVANLAALDAAKAKLGGTT